MIKGLRRRGTRMLLIATAMLAGASGIALATIPGSAGVINGCYEKRTGLLRVIDAEAGKKCTYWETPITWSQQYLAGEGLTLTGNVFSVADGSLNAADFSTVDEEGLTSDNIKNESLSGTDLENGTVMTGDVANESLTDEDLDSGSVAASEVANESLTSDELDNASVAASEVENESLTGADLANGSVATRDIRANAVTNAVEDLDRELTGPPAQHLAGPPPQPLAIPLLEPVVSATINLPSGGESGPPQADHKVLVTGQVLVECSANCAQPSEGTVSWQLWEPPPTAAPPIGRVPQPLGPVQRARLLSGNTFIASVSQVLTRSDLGSNEHQIDFQMWIPGPPSYPDPHPTRVRVTQASLTLIDLGSV